MDNCVFVTLIIFVCVKNSYSKFEERCKSVDARYEPGIEIDASLNILDQGDPLLIEEIKKRLIPPSPDSIPYNFTRKEVNVQGQFGEAEELARAVFGKQKEGFFIEAGAYDGEALSNTLHFEANMKWKGVLVEPNPDLFKSMVTKNRKANLFGHCLSTKTTPETVSFDAAGVFGGIINDDKKPGEGYSITNPNHEFYYQRKTVQVQCFPLYSILLALGNPQVDLLSLDIEGAEIPVLRSIPWAKVNINVIILEVNHLGKIFDASKDDLHKIMSENGYKFLMAIHINHVYIKEGFKPRFRNLIFNPIL